MSLHKCLPYIYFLGCCTLLHLCSFLGTWMLHPVYNCVPFSIAYRNMPCFRSLSICQGTLTSELSVNSNSLFWTHFLEVFTVLGSIRDPRVGVSGHIPVHYMDAMNPLRLRHHLYILLLLVNALATRNGALLGSGDQASLVLFSVTV